MSSLQLLTNQGTRVSIPSREIDEFRGTIRGEVLTPDNDGYDSARKIYNASIDKRPSLIVRTSSARDVLNAVNLARKHHLLLAVRGGGHNVAGKSVCDQGLVVDFSLMKNIQVDTTARRAHAEPGLRLGEFDRATQEYGLATPLGIVSNTGIAGLTLGGGIGWLSGKYGLACDNLLSVQIVTADGQLLTASSDMNQDLFWGLRGGGGNFGIVTTLEYKLHPVGNVTGGMLLYSIDKAKHALSDYDTFARNSPDELTSAAALLTAPSGDHVMAIVMCYTGRPGTAEIQLRQLRTQFGPPLADLVREMKYVEMQSLLDAAYPPGNYHYWKSSFMTRISENAVDTILRFDSTKPSPLTAIIFQQMHGAASRVRSDETAFPHRRNQYNFAILSQWSQPEESQLNVDWTRKLHEAMHPFMERDVYVNDLGEEGEDRVRAAYGQNYDRLAQLKSKYDPANFFQSNQNIKPHRLLS